MYQHMHIILAMQITLLFIPNTDNVVTLENVLPSLLVALQTYTPSSDNCTSNMISVVANVVLCYYVSCLS